MQLLFLIAVEYSVDIGRHIQRFVTLFYNAGNQLPTFTVGSLTFGIIICNDTNYIEPSRVMAAKGATVLFVPTNNCLPPNNADVVARARSTQAARAVENGLTVIAADVAGRQGAFVSYGSTNIIDPDGAVLASSKPFVEDLLIADIEPEADKEKRGWDDGRFAEKVHFLAKV